MKTWDDRDSLKLTWGEVCELKLIWDDWANLSNERILEIAYEKLDQFKKLPDDIVLPQEFNERLEGVYQAEKINLPEIQSPSNGVWSKKITEKLFDALLALAGSLAGKFIIYVVQKYLNI